MPEIASLRFEDITVGQVARFEVTLTDDMVSRFAELSGDMNPLHIDESYANETAFKGPLVHGMLGASFFSRLVGMYLPGRFALYLSQQLLFREPIRIGITVDVCGTVMQKTDSAQTIKLKTQLLEHGTMRVLIDGEALIKLLA